MLSNFLNRIKLPFRKEKELYVSLRQIIGFYPRDIELYKTALLHKSIARRNDKGKPVNNERLEFLGDAILDAVVGDIVFQHFPGKREGFLTNTRSKLVQRETLGRLAKEMGINDLIVSASRNQSHNSYMGGNAFEALVGAIYLDRGYDACMRFMQKRILSQLINIDKVAYKEVNFKSKLLEWTQKNRVRMEFQLLQQKKDENGSPVFAYQVVIEGIKGASATGYSKKESQQTASKLTLEMLRKQPQFIDAVFAAKTDRTKMEEEPTMAVPSTEESQDFFVNPEPVEPAREAIQPLRESVQPVHEAKPLVREAAQPVREAKQPVREPAQPACEPESKQPLPSNQKPRRAEAKEQKSESDNRPVKQQQPSSPKQQSSAPNQQPSTPQKQEEKAAEKEATKVAKPAKKARAAKQQNAKEAKKVEEKPAKESKPSKKGKAATTKPSADEPQKGKDPAQQPQEATAQGKPSKAKKEPKPKRQPKTKAAKEERPQAQADAPSPKVPVQNHEQDDEFDLSDISARQQSREEIIAAAEAAAFAAMEAEQQ